MSERTDIDWVEDEDADNDEESAFFWNDPSHILEDDDDAEGD